MKTLLRNSFQHLKLGLIVGRTDVLDVPGPRSEECTVWTARAPDPVLTVSAEVVPDLVELGVAVPRLTPTLG